ncbi:methyltransferase [Ignicoccus pacificus DSM 13166]|uniref:Methyltransferase n=1 Tax=Ignicoccus pacificus DSM 13166 TaxID=940294 RepID=A0A977PKX8_9CREN|nr:methyltransferase [Ignicoccus pacificus DSM 13166]
MKLLKRIAKEVLGDEEIWSRIDVVGDIALIHRKFGYPVERLRVLGEELVRRMPGIRAVYAIEPGTEGPYKLRKLIHLAGERRTRTVYKEHGCEYEVDVEKAFVVPRLSGEHLRIARLVEPWETVFNMFAGVGPFSILIAKMKGAKVYSVDINPVAYELMVRNVKRNKVEGKVVPILGDSADVSYWLKGKVDRVLMPLPELAPSYLDFALLSLKYPGKLHLYLHVLVRYGERPKTAGERVARTLIDSKCSSYELEKVRLVRTVGPRIAQVVADLTLNKCSFSPRLRPTPNRGPLSELLGLPQDGSYLR